MAATPDIRVLADDLTGALDSAVAFADADAGMRVAWWPDVAPQARMAIDAATREGSEPEAVARHGMLAPWLAGGDLCFKKIDSLLRGHVVAEVAACARAGRYERIIVAPAFPFQKRVMRGGRQWRLDGEGRVGPDLAAEFRHYFAVGLAAPGEVPHRFLTLYDAETEADLEEIARTGLALGAATLWVGAGALAGALAQACGIRTAPAAFLPATRPFLGLVGTNHEVTCRQIARLADLMPEVHVALELDAEPERTRGRLLARMEAGAPSVVTVATGGTRAEAARAIADAFFHLLADLPSPGTLLVTGGETLRTVCDIVGADHLVVESEIEPGLAVSRMAGGRFDGLVTISKSGAFGDDGLLLRFVS